MSLNPRLLLKVIKFLVSKFQFRYSPKKNLPQIIIPFAFYLPEATIIVRHLTKKHL